MPWRTSCVRKPRPGRRTIAGLAFALVFLACDAGPAAADDLVPVVSPDRLADAPSTRLDPWPTFDNFAWRAFIALNWPARAGVEGRGEPDRSRTLGDPGPRVWETFRSRDDLLPFGGGVRPVPPPAFASDDGPTPCRARADTGTKALASLVPYAEFNQPGFAAGQFLNPLVARNRTYVRYETRVNREEYDAIAASGWTEGRNLPDAATPANLPIGSIAVKAAWRVLTAADTPGSRARYYVVPAEVVDVAASVAAGKIVCGRADIALVGLHIMVKTRYRPQWIWATFEHVDNVPPAGLGDAREPDARDAGAPYSFFDEADPRRTLPPLGSPEAQPVSEANPPAVAPEPMQVRRSRPLHASTMAMNRSYWALPGVKGTIWERYMLVASQWPTTPVPFGPENNGGFFPGLAVDPAAPHEAYQSDDPAEAEKENLANTTLETYLQATPSSCMSCHASVANARGFDFAGILAALR